jgi:TM2 domain-containing membrane protein YozV
MKKTLLIVGTSIAVAISSVIVTSCSTNKNVVGKGFLTKRKYLKGYFLDIKSNDNDKVASNRREESVKKIDYAKKNVNEHSNLVSENLSINKETFANFNEVNTYNADNNLNNQVLTATSKVKNVYFSNKINFNKNIETKKQYEYKKIETKKESSTSPSKPEGKSQLVALLLCIFVGALGIHRFYLGYIGIGIIQLLTAGGCGIWALIDLIMIITGDLKPKDGDYEKKL